MTNAAGNPLPVQIPPRLNVFLTDRSNHTISLVSANLSGTGGGNGDSIPTSLSSNGQYVLFESTASDLVPSDTNGVNDVFVRDMLNGTTRLVSVSTNGGFGNGSCRGSVMTPDARFVAFVSEANNLMTGDTNKIADVFRRDLQSNLTALVSVGAKTTNNVALSASSESPDITPDGRYVAFFSTATGLVASAATPNEIYVRDLLGGTTTWASSNSLVILQSLLGATNAVSYSHTLSEDGNLVAFEASPNPTTATAAQGIILRVNLGSGTADVVSTNAYAPNTLPYEDVRNLDMAPDGQWIAYVANTNGTSGTTTCIHLWGAQNGNVTLVSGDLSNTVQAGTICRSPSVDESGRFVAFLSSATNLVTNSLSGEYHSYVRDVLLASTTLVDAGTNAVGSGVNALAVPRLSADGQYIGFESFDANLVANDRNHAYDVFLRNVRNNSTELISARHASLPSASGNGSSGISPNSISADARFVAFVSEADNLVPDDTNGVSDIFVRDQLLGTTLLVSAATNGLAADGPSSESGISGDGRFVAFTSSADNLVAGDTNRVQDVFLKDLLTGTTLLVSQDTTGTSPGNNASYSPYITPDGRYVLFISKATNLGPGTSGAENLFLRDLQFGTTTALTTNGMAALGVSANGRFVSFVAAGNISVWDLQLGTSVVYTNVLLARDRTAVSPNGRYIVYLGSQQLHAIDRLSNSDWQISTTVFAPPRAGLRFSADSHFMVFEMVSATYTFQQVFLYDFEKRSSLLISTAFAGGGAGNANCDSPEISPDGRFIAYRSFATNLVGAADTNIVPDLFLHDRALGTTTLLSSTRYGTGPADNRSSQPFFSADGRTLMVRSWASDTIALDFNQGADVLALGLLYASVAFGSPGQGPTIRWLSRPGESYHVQFKDDLGDGGWQEVIGTVTSIGNQSQLTDLAPSAGQRFYRVAVY